MCLPRIMNYDYFEKNKHMRKKHKDKCTCMWKVPFQHTQAWRVPRKNKHSFSLTMRHNTTSAQEIQHVPRHDSKTPEKTPTCFVFQTLTNHAFSLPKVWKDLRKTNLNSWCVPSVCLNRCMENSMCQYLFRVLEPKSGKPSIAVAFWWFWIKIWRAWKSAVFQTSSTRAACLLVCVLRGLAAKETYPFKHKFNKRNHHHKNDLENTSPWLWQLLCWLFELLWSFWTLEQIMQHGQMGRGREAGVRGPKKMNNFKYMKYLGLCFVLSLGSSFGILDRLQTRKSSHVNPIGQTNHYSQR